MAHICFECVECGARQQADMSALGCAECAAPLDVAYADAPTDSDMPSPLHSPADAVTLGEGRTPVVPLLAAARLAGVGALYAKLEMMNPTGSFKDRGTAVMMSAACEWGVSAVVEDSSGNAGASVAAYAARAGIRAHVFAPADAPTAKLGQIRVYGAKAHLIEGGRQAVADAAVRFAAEHGIVYASHNLSPYFIEGTKAFAYEVRQQFSDALPAHIVVPVGNGSLLLGAHKGFTELRRAGVVDAIPRLHAVQARAVMPIAAAFAGKSEPPSAGRTAAGGIAVAKPPRLRQVLAALQDVGGTATAVDDADILRWQTLLAEREGIFAEPTSAAAFAGIEALAASGAIGGTDTVLAPITGFGLKDAFPAG